MTAIRAIHVGVGGRGEWPPELMRADRSWQSVALVDTNRDVLASAAAHSRLDAAACFSSLEDALAKVEADAVVVITPSALHGRFIATALAAGKHVLVEKPFVHTMAEAERLVKTAETAGLRLVVAQNYRYGAPQQTLRRLLAQEVFGTVGYSTLIHHRHRPNPRAFTMAHPLLIEMAVHHFDDMRAVFGRRPISVAAHSFNPPWSAYPHAAAAQALITFDGGLRCCYQASFVSHDDHFAWRIECEKGALCWDGSERLHVASHGGERSELALDAIPAVPEQCILDDWRLYIEQGIEPEISGRNNLATLSMLTAAITSSDEGRIVTIE
jgi:predicted dehydrogenase